MACLGGNEVRGGLVCVWVRARACVCVHSCVFIVVLAYSIRFVINSGSFIFFKRKFKFIFQNNKK